MSQVFDTDGAVKLIFDFLHGTDMGRVSGVNGGDSEEQAEEGRSSDEESGGDRESG
jgi:hypothetical protein